MNKLVTGLLVTALGLATPLLTPALQASPLLDSIRGGEVDRAMQLLQNGADANSAQANGTTALHWAVNSGDRQLVEQLLSAGADPNALNRYGASPMSEAALLGDTALLKALLDAGADVESANADGMTALMILSRSPHTQAAQLLLEHGADVNAKEQWKGQTAVMWAAAQAQPEMLALLLEAGGDPNVRSIPNDRERHVSAERRFQWRAAGGFTPLAYAAREGCVECARLLVEAGADIDRGDIENVTPLNLAIMNLRFDTAKYLIEAGANVNKWSLRGENPVYSAVDMNTLPHGGYPDRPTLDEHDALDVLALLLDAGANPNLQMKLRPTYRHLKDDRGADRMLDIGATPLLRAAKGHDIAAIELLVKHGALLELPNRDGTTPLMAAAGLSASDIDTRGDYTPAIADINAARTIEALVAAGANLDASDNSGRTALHGAATWGWNATVQTLVDAGANLTAKDNGDRSPLDYALGNTSAFAGRGGGSDPHPATATLIQDLLLKQ